MAQTRQYIGRTKYKKGIIRMICVYPRFSLSKREQKQAKNDEKQKTKRLILPIHRRRSWSSFMYGQFFFLPFLFFSPSLSLDTPTTTEFTSPPDSLFLSINKKKKTNNIVDGSLQHSPHRPSLGCFSSFVFRYQWRSILAAYESRSLTEEGSHLARCF